MVAAKRIFDLSRTLALAAFLLTYVGAANAVSLLTLEAPSTFITQQTAQNPCIFGDPSCTNPAGFGFTLFPSGGAVTSYDESSPLYTVQQILDIVNSTTFSVGIDINTAGGHAPEILEFFSLEINGVEEFVFTGPAVLQAVNNGTGYSDSRLLGFDLGAFNPADQAQFFIKIEGATDGRENAFLISEGATEIPEPGTVMLLGASLLGAALRRRMTL